jgi:hypothetical protein
MRFSVETGARLAMAKQVKPEHLPATFDLLKVQA